jgi:hypothetical protein
MMCPCPFAHSPATSQGRAALYKNAVLHRTMPVAQKLSYQRRTK